MTIRTRLERLTTPAMKKFVSDAVAAENKAPSKDGEKLLEELNKTWVTTLKDFKTYDAEIAKVQKSLSDLAKVDDIESAEYAKVEKEIADVSSKTKNMDANLKKFEAAEEKVKKKYKL